MALKSFRAAAFAAKHFAARALHGVTTVLASLGAWGGRAEEKKKKPHKVVEPDVVEEAFPVDVVSRLREEMLSASLTAEVIARAKQRSKRIRAEESALLLMI